MVTRATEWSYFAFPEVYTGNGNTIDRKYIVSKFLWGGEGRGGGGAQKNLLLCLWDSFVAFIALGLALSYWLVFALAYASNASAAWRVPYATLRKQ